MKIQKKQPIVLGIDIGGTNSAFGLVDEKGRFQFRSVLPTHCVETPEELFALLLKEIQSFLIKHSQFELKGVGIGAPNGNIFSGETVNPPNLRWPTTNLVRLVQKIIDTKVMLTNDANAAALGEMRFGNAIGMQNFIVITLGTGLGSGIVINGKVVYGSDGLAGELGHITAVPNGRPCNCGRLGCLETYASAEGIKRTVIDLLADGPKNSILKEINPSTLRGEIISQAAEAGDLLALKAFQITAEILGRALADSVAILSPEAIVIFGGLAQAGDFLMQPLKNLFEVALLPIHKGKVPLLPSGLQAGDAAILGAAALIWNNL